MFSWCLLMVFFRLAYGFLIGTIRYSLSLFSSKLRFMVYNELCHKEIHWSKSMKQLLITLVAVVLGSTAMTSYAANTC